MKTCSEKDCIEYMNRVSNFGMIIIIIILCIWIYQNKQQNKKIEKLQDVIEMITHLESDIKTIIRDSKYSAQYRTVIF